MRPLKLFLDLSFKEKFSYLGIFWTLLKIRILLKTLSFNSFKTYFKKSSLGNNISETKIEFYVLAIKRLSKILKAVCLPQALCLKYYLADNPNYKLIIGVDNSKGFAAHAWVEKDKIIQIGDYKDINYTPLWEWK